jgi:nicotinamidase-related amidase
MSRFIDPTTAALILIDAQPTFFEIMAGDQEPVLARLEHLLLLGGEFGLPCLATFEQPVEKKGWLPERLERVFPALGRRFLKRTYNLCGEPEIRQAVRDLDREQLIVAGAETDVCVLQSVLGLIGLGFQVFLVEDCLFTAEPNVEPAIWRMRQAGVIPLTYKTLYYELKETVDVAAYHAGWNDRFGDGERRYVDPYDLPPFHPSSPRAH